MSARVRREGRICNFAETIERADMGVSGFSIVQEMDLKTPVISDNHSMVLYEKYVNNMHAPV